MTRLRLDLIVRTYGGVLSIGDRPAEGFDRWTWRLQSGSRIVSTSGAQLYSRRIDCARGAEVGAGICGITEALESDKAGLLAIAYRWTEGASEGVTVRILDERTAS